MGTRINSLTSPVWISLASPQLDPVVECQNCVWWNCTTGEETVFCTWNPGKAIYEDISWVQNRGFSTPLPGLTNLNCPALVRIPQHGCAGDKVKSGNLSGEAATLGFREDWHLDAVVVHQGAGQLRFLRGDQFALFEGAHKSCLEVGIDVCNLQELLIVKRRRVTSLILKGNLLQKTIFPQKFTLFPDNRPSSSTLPTTTPPPRMIWGKRQDQFCL